MKNMKELKRLIESEEAMSILNELAELNKCINAKCYTVYEEETKRKELNENLKRVKEIMKRGK